MRKKLLKGKKGGGVAPSVVSPGERWFGRTGGEWTQSSRSSPRKDPYSMRGGWNVLTERRFPVGGLFGSQKDGFPFCCRGEIISLLGRGASPKTGVLLLQRVNSAFSGEFFEKRLTKGTRGGGFPDPLEL